jgi:hypothetical protein
MTTEDPSNELLGIGKGLATKDLASGSLEHMGGHALQPATPGNVRVGADPNLMQIWAQDGSRRTPPSGCIAPLERRAPDRQSVGTRANALCRPAGDAMMLPKSLHGFQRFSTKSPLFWF